MPAVRQEILERHAFVLPEVRLMQHQDPRELYAGLFMMGLGAMMLYSRNLILMLVGIIWAFAGLELLMRWKKS